MFLTAVLLQAATAIPLSRDVELSPAVIALSQKQPDKFSPRFEAGLNALEKAGDESAAALLGELLMMPDRPGGPDLISSCNHSQAAPHYPEGIHNLATCYFQGSGRPLDLPKARELYRQATERGYAKSACAYGNMLIVGQGGPVDVPRGLDLCKRAADAGVPDAQTDYGGYLLTGQYLAKDAIAARNYLTLAGEQGQPNAAFLLGQIFWNGDGVLKDIPQAAIWWIKAYEGGRRDAAYLIGNAAMKLAIDDAQARREVPTVVIEQARKWLAIAAREDPDPTKRSKAVDLQKLLAELLAGSASNGDRTSKDRNDPRRR